MRSTVGLIGVVLLVGLSALGAVLGLPLKVLGIAWVAFLAMGGGVWLGRREAGAGHANRLVWGYGLASGAMVTSAALFLVPEAVGHHVAAGGIGIAVGVIAGYSAHTVGHRLTHVEGPFDALSLRLAAHSLADGAVIGIVYATVPALGPLLGLAIVSHKAPAGYAAAHRLAANGRSVTPLLLPAAGVGIAAIPAALISVPAVPWVTGLVFGFAAGVFVHVAMDFLPQCEVGGEIHDLATSQDDGHALLDRLRLHAVASTSFGGVVVVAAWVLLSGQV